ncbi:hypothetical protein QTL97_04005 [Sporosarcina thermotolerans]|uniref:LXG domain-containing protein n=1 Tax=Sporosarcina thermotolerans TaxID=633404 RepID=A0AAW9A4R9_9BACL|nr:hypothetical protein [Sporosarcina thermotolerans]MDW0116087.1 hypothetical protein [Sporosarcina thermotolerans]WHT48058.1 hypothetical protein QNH10_18780 [Sporosarcina thermotolerans]
MEEFIVMQRPISFSPEEILFHELRSQYEQLAMEYADKFEKDYAQFKTIENVVQHSMDTAMNYMAEVAEFTADLLRDWKIYTVDEEIFFKHYISIDNLLDGYDFVCGEYEKIIDNAKELNAYRTARREYRGRISGGGFGLEGAVKGMATAGALNLATGVLHGTFNIIGSIGSAMANSVKKGKLYKNPELCNSLVNGLYIDILDLYKPVIQIINEELGYGLKEEFTELDYQRKKGLLSNIERISSEEEQKSVLIDLLKIDPTDFEIYLKVLSITGDPDGSLGKMADNFGVPLFNYKMNQLFDIVEQADIEDEEDAEFIKQKILQHSFTFGIDEEKLEPIYKELENRIEKFKRLDFDYLIEAEAGEVAHSSSDVREIIHELMESLPTAQRELSLLFDEAITKCSNALSHLTENGLEQGEWGIFQMDDSPFGNGKGGILLTNRHLYYKNTFSKPKQILLGSIEKITNSKDEIIINDHDKIQIVSIKRDTLSNYVSFLIKVVALISKTYNIREEQSASDQYAAIKKRIISIKEKKVREKLFLPNENPKAYANAIHEYVTLSQNEEILILFDDTIWSTAKKGFAITNHRLHLNLKENNRSFPLTAIEEVGCRGESHNKHIVLLMSNGEEVICKPSILEAVYWDDLLEPIADAIFDLSDMINDEPENIELMEPTETETNEEIGYEETVIDTREESVLETIAHTATIVEKPIKTKNFAKKVEGFYQSLNKNIEGYFYPCDRDDTKSQKRLKGALGSYAKLSTEETPYLLFDNTAFGSAKDGFLLSNEAIYYHNMWSNSGRIAYADIEDIEFKGNLYINGNEIQLELIGKKYRPELVDQLKQLILG